MPNFWGNSNTLMSLGQTYFSVNGLAWEVRPRKTKNSGICMARLAIL